MPVVKDSNPFDVEIEKGFEHIITTKGGDLAITSKWYEEKAEFTHIEGTISDGESMRYAGPGSVLVLNPSTSSVSYSVTKLRQDGSR
jgi:hypothetical protein